MSIREYRLQKTRKLLQNDDPASYIAQLQEQYEQRSSGSPAWFLAMTYAVLGDDQATLEGLEKSYERHEVEMTWLKMEPYQDDPPLPGSAGSDEFPQLTAENHFSQPFLKVYNIC